MELIRGGLILVDSKVARGTKLDTFIEIVGKVYSAAG